MTKKPRVLVVDDEKFARQVLRDALEQGGYEVIEAQDGMQALEIVRQSLPDLVLLDVYMPNMDGITTCSRLRERAESRNLPVLMVTASDDTKIISRAYAAGATDFITKPINWTHLRHHVRYVLRSSRLFEELRRNETRLAEAQRIAGLGHWEWDPALDMLVCSDEALRVLGLPPETPPGPLELFLDPVHPEDLAEVRFAVKAALEGKPLQSLEYRIRLADGSQRFVHVQAEVSLLAGLNSPKLSGTIQDISARKSVEEKLRLSAKVFDNSGEMILITDRDGNILDANSAFCRITGYGRAGMLGKNMGDLKSGLPQGAFARNLTVGLLQTGQWQGEVLGRRSNGETFPALVTINAARDVEGEITHFVAIAADISQLKETQQRLQYLADFDPLTDFPNRHQFQARLQQALAEAGGNAGLVAVLFFDLDDFKEVNDTLGYKAGDQVLKEVALRLQGFVGGNELVARLGSDEFGVILRSLEQTEQAAGMAQKLLLLFDRPFLVEGRELYVSGSAGISLNILDGAKAAGLVKKAETAMHYAKLKGKGSVKFFSEHMNVRVQERLALKTSLRQALRRDEFFLHYQPKFNSQSGLLTGMEALARWQHPGRGLVRPAHFIPLAEETGLIVPLGENMLLQACAQNVEWQARGFPPFRVAVNLSTQQFQDKNLVQMISRVLAETGLDPKWLELEITETVLMQDTQKGIDMLARLKAMGIRISLDDFGTGYSSLSYLKRLPVDCLKIDYTFVKGIFANVEDAAIIRAIIAMAHTLNLKVIAEGVETEEQRTFLREQGCDEVQGYLAAMPLPVNEVERFLM